MALAKDVAAELRKLADALDKEPKTDIRRPTIWFHHEDKQQFLNLARLMPRPFTKTVWTPGSIPAIRLTHTAEHADIEAVIDQRKMCRLIRPAVPAEYECEPLLSQEEEDALA